MKNDYKQSNFKTKGFWLIPFILGVSKSVVGNDFPIGIMYTLHITPFINLGFNNPFPTRYPVCTNNQSCCGNCSCGNVVEEEFSDPCDRGEINEILDDMVAADPRFVNAYITHEEESGEMYVVLEVVDQSVDIPEEICDLPTVKRVRDIEDEG